MVDENVQDQVSQYRAISQSLGNAALEAMHRGDVGLTRTAARQAAQYARLVMQLETGEKLIEPEESERLKHLPASQTS